MATNKINVDFTYDYTWEVEAAASEDKSTSVLKYKDDYDGWLTRCPAFGTEHPDLDGYLLAKIKASREPGDQIAVTCTYECTNYASDVPGRPGGEEPVSRFGVRVGGREEHILTNGFASTLTEKELKALYAISNGSEADEKNRKWETDVTSDTGLAILAKIRKGNTAYKTGGIIYFQRTTVDSLADLRYSKLFKIDDPPGSPGGATNGWLYLGGDLDPSADGATWAVEFQWEYSPDGWDTDLYSDPPP